MEEQDIQIRNKTEELSGLSLECTEKAKELTELLVLIDTTKKGIIELDRKTTEFDEYCAKNRSEMKEECDRITAERMKLNELKESTTLELVQLKSDIKIANKELSWVNDKVFKAREELKEVEDLKRHSEQKVIELNRLVEMVPGLQSTIIELEGKRNTIRIEISEMLDSSTLELSKAKEELVKITNEVGKKIGEANQAEYRCKKYVDELYTHMNDYEIVKTRLESIYKEKFPELDLKI